MMQIRPVSDLRNKFLEIESLVNKGGTVYLTKNGHGAMVAMSLEMYARLTGNAEAPAKEDSPHDAAPQGMKKATKKAMR